MFPARRMSKRFPCGLVNSCKMLRTAPIWLFSRDESPFPLWSLHLSHMCSKNTGHQRFCPMRKIVCFWCILGRWIRICFQNFSITHTFRSRLKGWNLLRQDTKFCFYRGRHEEFKDCFFLEDGVVFCNDVCSVMEVLGHEYNRDQWRLFSDSSKVSLKVAPLHSANRFPSVTSAHAANMKESI